MLKKEIKDILEKSRKWGWVLEPAAKKIFAGLGMRTPRFAVATDADQCVALAHSIGYPVVAKIVSPSIVHKSDVQGVVVGIVDDRQLIRTFQRFSKLDKFAGMLIEETIKGIELILGCKNDLQFGPMILLGMGGVGVEIYKDVVLRMAPLKTGDFVSMVQELKANKLLTGYRGSEPVNMKELRKLVIAFSNFMMNLQDIVESVDLNPVICNSKHCIVADARIMLKK
jgi:acetate---CoA ligase (ADP-forming) subunit beta